MSPLVAGATAVLAVAAALVVVAGTGATLDEVRVRRRVRALVAGEAGSPVVPAFRLPAPVGAAVRSVIRRAGRFTGSRERHQRRADRDLPTLLDQVTRQLRSGASLPAAVRVAASGQRDPSTARMADDLAVGTPLVDAVEAWHAACPTAARGLAAAALGLAVEAGGAVAVVLDGVTDTLRDRVALEREVAALSSQSRASAGVLVAAPIGFAALAATVDGRVATALLGTPVGWACLAGGAVLDGLGALWMARLVARAR